MKVCAECPFRKNAPRGWLGTFESADEMRRYAVSEAAFSCHTKTDAKTNLRDSKLPQCAGRLVFAAKSCKSFRDPDLEMLKLEALAENDRDKILSMMEFVPHHEPNLKQIRSKKR